MQLVIEIPDDVEDYGKFFDCMSRKLDEVMHSAVVLPKGHGRLIDANKLEPRDMSPEAWYSPMW